MNLSNDKAYSYFDWQAGKLADCDPNFPTTLSAWVHPEPLGVFDVGVLVRDGDLILPADGSHFGFVFEGHPVLSVPQGDFSLEPGMYFSVNTAMRIRGGRGIVMTRHGHRSFFHIGGPVEKGGRLKYIDGCTDSLLIPPIKLGDPCLNLLYFPENIDQTEHTHPSDRIGLIASGHGWCVTPDNRIELYPGQIFRIHAEGKHKFQTLPGEDMTVIAYHPDSDFGPTDEVHPMVNRTIVDGVSASQIAAIRTR